MSHRGRSAPVAALCRTLPNSGPDPMSAQRDVAEALERAVALLTRRPDKGLHEDAKATVAWQGGTRTAAFHENGLRMDTDMPTELGGNGSLVSPGWLFRAGIAACGVTVIAMVAASEGIELEALTVEIDSTSDTRGALGMKEPTGDSIYPGPTQLRIAVRIRAPGVDAARLRGIVEEGLRRSPIQNAIMRITPLSIALDTGDYAVG